MFFGQAIAKPRYAVLATANLILFFALPIPSSACSVVACIDKGIEVRQDFVVQITHEGIPLSGVTITVTTTTDTDEKIKTAFSGLTATDGSVHISSLVPGEYWLRAAMLGIIAGTECFHVRARPSKKAKKLVKYFWGNLAPTSRQIAGRLIDTQPGEGETPLAKLMHQVDVPVSGALFKLQNALTGSVFRTASDRDGAFSFGFLPNGIYVLHVEGGRAGAREYDFADILIRLNDGAASDTLVLRRRDAGGGSCGGTSLELQRTRA
jgi:hypothetical protein